MFSSFIYIFVPDASFEVMTNCGGGGGTATVTTLVADDVTLVPIVVKTVEMSVNVDVATVVESVEEVLVLAGATAVVVATAKGILRQAQALEMLEAA
jgi:hypothetical protein